MIPQFADPDTRAVPVHILARDGLEDWLDQQPAPLANWARSCGFRGGLGEILRVPDEAGQLGSVLLGWGDGSDHTRTRFAAGTAAKLLKSGVFKLEGDLSPGALEEACLGWLLAHYRFDRYAAQTGSDARLIAPKGVDAKRLEHIAAGEFLTRDLINTPAADMGPEELEAAIRALASEFDATVRTAQGEALITQNFPMIHAVGRAAAQEPRLIEMTWSAQGAKTGPLLTLVGKGVCFDTGGLNLKPGASMGLMKKDMGGAATVLGLARMIMGLALPLRLRVLVPAVENSVAGNAFRPGDILTARNGKTVEINNTDAEGRLVLADALAYADEDPPALLVCMATLTGAARVAVGPDLAPYFTDDDALAMALNHGGQKARDPVWRLPLHRPYEPMIEPGIADLDNAPSGGFAGAITAALFLDRFVTDTKRFVHFDIYGWNPSAKPGRPKGGVGMGARAILEALPGVLDL